MTPEQQTEAVITVLRIIGASALILSIWIAPKKTSDGKKLPWFGDLEKPHIVPAITMIASICPLFGWFIVIVSAIMIGGELEEKRKGLPSFSQELLSRGWSILLAAFGVSCIVITLWCRD